MKTKPYFHYFCTLQHKWAPKLVTNFMCYANLEIWSYMRSLGWSLVIDPSSRFAKIVKIWVGFQMKFHPAKKFWSPFIFSYLVYSKRYPKKTVNKKKSQFCFFQPHLNCILWINSKNCSSKRVWLFLDALASLESVMTVMGRVV